MKSNQKLVFLGVGKLALSVADAARRDGVERLFGTTRSGERFSELESHRVSPILFSDLLAAGDSASDLLDGAYVLVSIPPLESSPGPEEMLADLCKNARKVIYISSTTVYGSKSGLINEDTAVCSDTRAACLRLKAEEAFRQSGAMVLRAPALYGFDRGMHTRLLAGSYQMPANADNFVSRIHQDDLARIILASFKELSAGAVYVVGDHLPARHREVLEWLCLRLKLDYAAVSMGRPQSESPGGEKRRRGEMLRGDRAVDGSLILQRLKLDLAYPTYKEGYGAILQRLGY